jgi:hypothetical protein
MTKQLHVKNHFVPQFYLKKWEENENVFCYSTLVSHEQVPLWNKYQKSAIAYKKHLYTQVVSGQETDEIEVWFDRHFESPASEVIEKATNDRQLSKDDWKVLIRFLALQDIRTPARMLDHLKWIKKELPDILQKVLTDVTVKVENQDHEAPKQYDITIENSDLLPLKVTMEFEDGKDIGVLTAESYIGRSTWIHSIKNALEHTLKILHTYRWSIVKPAKGYTWFTSDNPVIKLNYINSTKYDLKGGWGVTKGNIIFPIGPEHAMFVQIGDRPPIPKGTRLSVGLTKEFRKFIAENSHRFIYSKQIDDEVSKLRERVVDDDRIRRERKEMENWHKKNSEMEREYLKRYKRS